MSSAQSKPRRGKRARKQTAKGRDYLESLTHKATTRIPRNAHSQAQSSAVANSANDVTNGTRSGQGDAHGEPRRSKRIRERIDGNSSDGTSCDTRRPNKRRRVSQPGPSVEGFMIKLYAEIHHAATVKTIGQWERYWTQHLLRQARTLRFFGLLAAGTGRRVRARLNKFESNDPKEKRVASLAKVDIDIDVDHAQRLIDFCDDPNLLLLAICAHSKSFRDAVARSDLESRAQGEPEWSDIYPRIKRCASSLELFARTHKFDWTDALFTFNDHFNDLLIIVYKDCRDGRDKNGANFGIGHEDLREIHQISTEDKHKVHHHWILHPEAREPAVWPSIRCTITQDLTKAGFVHGDLAIAGIPEDGDNLEVNPASILPLNSKRRLQQFNIDQSVVLPNYVWPEQTHKVIHKDGSVYQDPTFCGFPGNPCKSCGAEESLPVINIDDDSDSDTIVVGVPKKDRMQKDQQQPDRTCKCTFADLCKKHNKPPQDNHRDILVELYTTKEKGGGVRALQSIRQGTYLGEYTGEIYAVQPDTDDNAGSMVNHRYGLATYHMQVDIARADDYAVKAKKAKEKAKAKAKTTTTITRENRPQYTIDAAHRGGWTRYINHSCAPNTQYVALNLGQRTRIVIQAKRKIAFGEEITVDYGAHYFENLGMSCRCGEAKCKHENVVSRGSSESESESSGGSDEAEGE